MAEYKNQRRSNGKLPLKHSYKSAIKAKLVDLGVYVDDELPDYIMVMVANKKTQEQMTEDLNLFLGNNTQKFTSWLHALLQKLQSITADPPKPPEAPPGVPEEAAGVTGMKEPPEQEEDELLIGPEHDDFEEEATREAAVPVAGPGGGKRVASQSMPAPDPGRRLETSRSSPPSRPTQPSVWSTRSSAKSTVSSHEPSRRRERENSPRRDLRSRLGVPNRQSEKSSQSTLQKQRAAVRKRRAPESVVGSVVRHDVEEEQYDPRRPLIGRVASTVKVGDRRPTVPPAQQANKSLLLKAMTEARDSIAKATARLTEQVAMDDTDETAAGPVTRRGGSDRARDRDRAVDRDQGGPVRSSRGRQGLRSRLEPRGTMRSSGSSQRITRVAPQPPEPSRENGTNEQRSVQLYSRSKREEVLQQFRAGLESDSEDASNQGSGTDDISAATLTEIPTDNRQIHLTSMDTDSKMEVEEVEESEQRVITVAPLKPEYHYEDETLDTLIESGADESDFTEDEGESRIVEEKLPEPPKERPSSPKFVVTLDGVDPATLAGSIHSGIDSDSEMHVDGDSPKTATIVRVAPTRITTSTPLSMDMSQSDYHHYLADGSEMDDESSVTPPKRSRVLERCKFWLACRNGNQCPYHHPSVPCKLFPKCKFGDKCLYIHPNCRFDANCTRGNCPFTHATKRPGQAGATAATALPVVIQPVNVVAAPPTFQSFSAPPTPTVRQPPSQVTCRFFPKCTNMNCKFLHPKPCRYGVGCREKANCTYTHPELPPANKLKWTAPKLGHSISMESTSSVR